MAATLAASPNDPIPILSQESDINVDGSYRSSYETGNKISAQEQGILKNAGQKDEASEVQGSYQWTAPDGQTFGLKYIANEGGFQPDASHLPTPPEIPAAILRAIEWNEKNPEAQSTQPKKL